VSFADYSCISPEEMMNGRVPDIRCGLPNNIMRLEQLRATTNRLFIAISGTFFRNIANDTAASVRPSMMWHVLFIFV